MTQTLEPIQSEDVERLELLISLNQHSVLVFCLYRSPEDIRNVQNSLSERLNIPIRYQVLNGKQLNPIRLVRDLPDQPRQVMFAVYEGNLDDELTTCAKYANIQRDALSHVEHPLIMWFREEAFTRFIRQAPDFLAWHSAILEFQSAMPPTMREALVEIETRVPELSFAEREKLVDQVESYEDLLRDFLNPNEDDLSYLGRIYGRLSDLLDKLGSYEKALEYGQEAAATLRRLVKERPQVSSFIVIDLAVTLNNLGNRYGSLGKLEEALRVNEESVQIYREVIDKVPKKNISLPGFATSLSNLGNRYGDLGNFEEAIKASEEAVQANRNLAKTEPNIYLAALAVSLSNLGNWYGKLGKLEDALKVTEEAVQIYRRIIEIQPNIYYPNFAISLSNLGRQYSNLARFNEALIVSEEAIRIYQELSETQLNTQLFHYAAALSNLGISYSDVGKFEEALKVSEESVEINRKLVVNQPSLYLPNLSLSLSNLANDYGALGRYNDAFQAIIESLNIIKPFYKTRPAVFSADVTIRIHLYFQILQNLEQAPDEGLLLDFEPVIENLFETLKTTT